MENYGHSQAVIDYRLVCRCCLSSNVEFYKLDAPLLDEDDQDVKLNFSECLSFCTNISDVPPQFPIYICTECASALQVAYNFIRNALDAHEILRLNLCPLQQGYTEKSKQYKSSQKKNNADSGIESEGKDKKTDIKLSIGTMDECFMHYRCKICGVKMETKSNLKEHVKLHLDIISYQCKMCCFQNKKRAFLSEHYKIVHGVVPSRDQLKPITQKDKFSSQTNSNIKEISIKEYGNNTSINSNSHFGQADFDCVDPPLTSITDNFIYDPNSSDSQIYQNQRLEDNCQTQHRLKIKSENEKVHRLDAENDIDYDMLVGNEMTVGNEFIVLADGTMEDVMENGVVIEYINTDGKQIPLRSSLVANGFVDVTSNENTANARNDSNDNIMDFDVIIEDTADKATNIKGILQPLQIQPIAFDYQDVHSTSASHPDSEMSSQSYKTKKIKCRICCEYFTAQDKLKTHMLTHKEIPHFFCDLCSFYTFFKIDLTQHYKTKHKMNPTPKQLIPKNRLAQSNSNKLFYTCDLCLYETHIMEHLRQHYFCKHQVQATEVHLRPTIDQIDINEVNVNKVPKKTINRISRSSNIDRPDYPNGLRCRKCTKVFYWQTHLKDHYIEHNEGKNSQHSSEPGNILNKQEIENANANTEQTAQGQPQISEISSNQNQSLTSDFNIPSDAIPQVVETDNIIDNDMDFDFNGDLFADFDGDVNNENRHSDSQEFQDLLLTSDDDFEHLLDEKSDSMNSMQQRPVCPFTQCNKIFYSQYHFENHMFVHRGLAPYRCEMCTNLYNTKRDLIRHYKAIHKTTPCRDMIQAKGDKVSSDQIPLENIYLDEPMATTYMCAKCPYESVDRAQLQHHLSTSHAISDEKYILKKLPYECLRCIRSFANKTYLLRHLEKSHSVVRLIQLKDVQVRNASINQIEENTVTNSANVSEEVRTKQKSCALNKPAFESTHIREPAVIVEAIATTNTSSLSCNKIYDESSTTNIST